MTPLSWSPVTDGTFSLRIHVSPDVPPRAVVPAVDWVHRVATKAYRLDGLPFDTSPAAFTLRIHWDPKGRHSTMKCSGSVLDATLVDVASSERLFRALGRFSDSPAGQPWGMTDMAPQGVVVDGTLIINDMSLGGDSPPANAALIDLVPGQGPVHPFVIPQQVDRPWVESVMNYVARVSISSMEPPLPCMYTDDPITPGAIVVVPDVGGACLRGSQIALPPAPTGAHLLQALARIPTYPERPFRMQAKPGKRQDPRLVFERHMQIEWEVDRIWSLLVREVIPHVDKDVMSIQVFVAEDAVERGNLKQRIEDLLASTCDNRPSVQVLSAFNQASSFGTEVFLRRAETHLGALDALHIGIPECLPDSAALERRSAWAPTVVALDEWLRQHRPDITATLSLVPGNAFQFAATRGEEQRYVEEFTPLTIPMNMEVIYPGKYSHPETGGVRLISAARTQQWTEPTDAEAAFRAYLPLLQEFDAQLDRTRTTLPLFGELSVEITVSDPDRLPGSMDFSILDELHEEVYFGTLAHFEQRIKHAGNGHWRAPGLIIPRIHQGAKQRSEVIVRATAPDYQLTTVDAPPLSVASIEMDANTISLTVLASLADFEPSILPTGVVLQGHGGVRVQRMEGSGIASPPQMPVEPADIWELSSATAFHVGGLAWIEGWSFGGRPIPAMLWGPKLMEGALSPRKMARQLPSVLIIAGHHANEPSSTPASFHLMHELNLRPTQAVVAIIPLENPDGAALYHELRSEHPYWKLHAARFNMVGHEFAQDYDRPSVFGEAKVRPDLERYIAANVVMDNHGVPAVPWVQPFSGRTSPPLFWFDYTYPSGLIYVIAGGDKATGRPTADVDPFWTAVTRRLNQREVLGTWQTALWDRYVRYGVALAPQDYPSRLVDGWPFQSMENATSSYRYNNEDPIRMITEVADEGANLQLFTACVAAHTEANLAVLDAVERAFLTEKGSSPSE